MARHEINFEVTVTPERLDREVFVMGLIVANLGPLDEAARRRVMRYLAARFADGVPPAAGTKPTASDTPRVQLCLSPTVMGGLCTFAYGHRGSHDRGPCLKCGERHPQADAEEYCPASS